MRNLLKRYRTALITLILFGGFLQFLPDHRVVAAESLWYQIQTMLFVLPPIFILLGLLDVWVPREMMIRHMGHGSGPRGTVLAFLLGSAAAGPLYGAFPVAAMLMKKGAGFFNVMVFIGAWSTTKVPMLLFEMKALGLRFALARLAMSIAGIIVIAIFLKAAIPEDEINLIYKKANQ